ncbi:MAG: GYD domain-containing protein [Burkholderiales bacterium]
MATYITLASFTDQGIRGVQDTVKRANAVKDAAKKFGVTMKDIHWTLGAHDMVVTFDAPDDAAMTALGLSIGKAGNVRTQTMRAFSPEEMGAILAKVG